MRFPALYLVLLIISPSFLFSQIQSASSVKASEFVAPAATLSKSVDEVNLAFTVTDKRGHFISNLGPNDFKLLDNHESPQRLTFFQQRSDLPLHVAVLIDASSSVEYRFRFETNAAAEFLKRILRPGSDQALLITFNDRIKTVVGPTDKLDKLSSSLKKLKAEGNTALNDAVIYASEKLHRLPENQITRRAIVLISDGVDTAHASTLEQAEQAASRAQVMIFSLSTNLSELDANGNGDQVLRQLASATGGALLPAHDEMGIDSALRNVQKALRNQYVLAYTPSGFMADGSYRRVELTAVKRGLRTNCRKGYYAKPAAQP